MKRHTLRSAAASAALACAVLACPAHAQSNVTIYGVADLYLEYGKGTATTYKLNSGGLSGSRLGFKGSEDLGGGLQALFQLETGMAMDTGTVTQGGVMWGRQALVGLGGAWGTATLGRQYTPHFIAVDTDDPFDTGAGSAASSGIVTVLAARANNSIAYESPKLGDFTVNLLHALGEGGVKLDSAYARYASGPVGVGLGWIRADTPEKTSIAVLSGAYDFGVVKLMGGFQAVRNLTGLPATEDDRTEWFAGLQAPIGAGVATLGYGTGKTKNVAGTRASQISAGYTYYLSKRTSLYGVLTSINNDVATAYTADTATGAGPATTPGQDVRALQVGLRHRF